MRILLTLTNDQLSIEKTNQFRLYKIERQYELENVSLATFVSRLFAFGIDCAIVFVFFIIVHLPYIINEFNEGKSNVVVHFEGFHNWLSLVIFLLYFGLYTYFSNGKTIGKKIFKIRVVSLLEERISLWHSFERAFGYGASFLEFGFGFFQYFIHHNRQTVHDRIAETIVVKEN
ncbi:MAG: RDD family protein [Bacteroidota bacterium]